MLLILLLGSTPVYSLDVLALRAGVSGNLGTYSVDDPNGSTDAGSGYSVTPVAVFVYSNEWRLWTEFDYKQFTAQYSSGNVGQKVKSYSLDAIMQRGFVSSTNRYFIGGGVSFSRDSYKERSLVDQDGFILQQYADRKEFNTALLIRAGYSRLIDDGSVGVNIGYQLPLNDGIRGIRLSAYWLFWGSEK